VLVSALLQPLGASAAILRAWRDDQLELIVCPQLLAELADVLARPKLRARVGREDALRLVALLRSQAELRADPAPAPGLTPAPRDDYVVALARETGADFLVSGDDHLQRVKEPPALPPALFLQRLPGPP
jgi:putative PIN family toxin of toxin-antitoxin system